MAKLSSVQQFGENFLAVMQNERKLRQEQEQFRQQMSQSMRQFDLLNSLRQEQLDLDKQRFGLDVEQESRMKEQAVGTLIGQGFRPVEEGSVTGRQNIRTNEFETQEPSFDLYDRKFAYPLTQPEMLKPYDITELEPFSIGNKSGKLEKKYSVDPFDPTNRRLIDTGTFYSDEPETSTENDNITPYKEGKLTESGAKALGFFTEPTIDTPNLFQSMTGIGDYETPQDVKVKIADNMATFAKDIVSSDTYKYIRNLFDKSGYVEPEVLKKNATDDADKGLLTEQQANEIATFLNYYDTMYEGIQRLEGAIK